MRFPWSHLLITLPLALSALRANADASDCRRLASSAEKPTSPSDVLDRIPRAMEPQVALSGVERKAREAILACPEIEQSWYQLARAWEMIGSPEKVDRGESLRLLTIAPFTLGPSQFKSLASLSQEALRRFPHSPRIALLSLLGSPSVSQAQALVDHFPDFPPLKLALAQAHLSAGDWTRALSIVREDKSVSGLPDAPALVAKSLLAQGDSKASLAALAKQTDPIGADLPGYEAYSCKYECTALRFKALLAARKLPEALRELSVIATEFPTMARGVLGRASPGEVTALEGVVGKVRLPAERRNALKKLLSDFAAAAGAGR